MLDFSQRNTMYCWFVCGFACEFLSYVYYSSIANSYVMEFCKIYIHTHKHTHALKLNCACFQEPFLLHVPTPYLITHLSLLMYAKFSTPIPLKMSYYFFCFFFFLLILFCVFFVRAVYFESHTIKVYPDLNEDFLKRRLS